jgi:hypothetical protein
MRWKPDVPIFTANHAGGKWLYEIRQLLQNGAGDIPDTLRYALLLRHVRELGV